jgi:hypothetical protein
MNHRWDDEAVEMMREWMFDYDYEIFDPAYRKVLETEILNRYWMDEINQETIYVHKMIMKQYMQRRMPYFSKLIEAMRDVDLSNVLKGTRTVTEKGTSDSTINDTSNSDHKEDTEREGKVKEDGGTTTDFTHDVDDTNTRSGAVNNTRNGKQLNSETHNDNTQNPNTRSVRYDYPTSEQMSAPYGTQGDLSIYDGPVNTYGTSNGVTEFQNYNDRTLYDNLVDKRKAHNIDKQTTDTDRTTTDSGTSTRTDNTKSTREGTTQATTTREYVEESLNAVRLPIDILEKYMFLLADIDTRILNELAQGVDLGNNYITPTLYSGLM